MSDLSDSSENYQQIINNLFHFKRQWAQVPEVVYLTAKALHSHAQEMEENIYSQRQIIVEQSVKIKQLSLELNDLRVKSESGWLDYQSAHMKESGFKKKRNIVDNSIDSKGGYGLKSRKKVREESPETKRKDMSLNMQNGLSEIMVEQVRALIEATIRQKMNIPNMQLEIEKIRKQLQSNEIKLWERVDKDKNEVKELDRKIVEVEDKIHYKLQAQRNNIMRFAQQSTIEIEKILLQISSIQIRLCDMTSQKEKHYSNPLFIKQQHFDDNQRTTKNGMKQGYIRQNISDKAKAENKLTEMVANINKDFTDFKLKTMKEMIFFMKTQTVQQILSKFQQQIMEKVEKNNKGLTKLGRQVQIICRDANKSVQKLGQNSDRNEYIKQQQRKQKKERSSEQSLMMIQQSLLRVEKHFKQKLKGVKKQMLEEIEKKVSQQCKELYKNIHEEMDMRQKTLCEIVQNNWNKAKTQTKQFSFQDSSTTKAIEKLSEQMMMSRYLCLGERPSKDFIQWDKNVVNFMEDNFIWKNNTHVVIIMAAGLYRVQAGLYSDNDTDKLEAYVMLNGSPISIMKNKQVPVNCLAPARGSIFNEAILIPAKSKIWLRTDVAFYGQAYLQILKL